MKVQIKSTLVYKGKVVPFSEIIEVTEDEGHSLVERGLALQIEEEAVAHEDTAPKEVDEAKKDYESHTVPELKEIAKTAEVDLTGIEKKGDIIGALIKKEFS